MNKTLTFESIDEREIFDILVDELYYELRRVYSTNNNFTKTLSNNKKKDLFKHLIKVVKLGENKAENNKKVITEQI